MPIPSAKVTAPIFGEAQKAIEALEAGVWRSIGWRLNAT